MVTTTTDREVQTPIPELANVVSSLFEGYKKPASYTNLNANHKPNGLLWHDYAVGQPGGVCVGVGGMKPIIPFDIFEIIKTCFRNLPYITELNKWKPIKFSFYFRLYVDPPINKAYIWFFKNKAYTYF